MGTLLDLASLVMIPSGYKEDKLYSVKPTDGSGDLDFTRSNDTATRVNSAGLVEKVRTNLLTYSQDFSNAAWNKSAGATLTHSQTDPNGGTTASRLQLPSSASNYLNNVISGVTNGGKYTHSIYMKSNTGSTQSVRILDGVRGVAGGAFTASVTTSWQRFEVVITTASTSAGIQIDNKGGAYDNDILVAFAQKEESDFGATDYIPTTSAAVSVGMTANVPRLDYTGGGCPQLLLEPQRTNSQTYSEQINNAVWGLSEVTVSANNATSPDGYTNADKIVEKTTTSRHEFYGVVASFSGNNAVSFFAKDAGRRYICALEPTGAGGATFDLQTGTVASVTAVSANIENYGNGWYRCSVIVNKTLSTQIYYCLRTSGSVGIETYTGDGTSGVLFYGAQTELAASYATSYINTLSAASTRGADDCFKTGINSLIGGTSGTIFFDITTNAVLTSDLYKQFFYYTDAGANQGYMYLNSSNVIVTNPPMGAMSSSITLSPNTRYKVALAYQTNNFALYVNGVSVATSSSGTPYNFENLFSLGSYGGTSEFNEFGFNQYTHFPTRLTNTQLAELTTL